MKKKIKKIEKPKNEDAMSGNRSSLSNNEKSKRQDGSLDGVRSKKSSN